MKVIERKNGWSNVCKCKKCESTLEINKSDLFTITYSDFEGGIEINVHFKCVVCNSYNEFSEHPNTKYTYPTKSEWEEKQKESTNR